MKISSKLLFLVLLSVLAMSWGGIGYSCAASVIYVNDHVGNDSYDGGSPLFSGGLHGPKATIQNGIDVVESNGAVYVANGVYREQITINKNVNIIGKSQKGVIIDGDHSGRAITINKDLKVNITCMTIQNTGYYLNEKDGGAIYSKASLTLKSVILVNNYGKWGGAIYNGGNLKIYNTQIQKSIALYGGAIYNKGTLFAKNTTISDNFGETCGGIYNDGPATIINSTIKENRGSYTSGGIGNFNKMNLKKSIIQNNSVGEEGAGGVYNEGTATIMDTIIRNNMGVVSGGGINNAGKLTLKNTTIYNNIADYGGGIYNTGKIAVKNSKIQSNQAFYGGGIFFAYGKATILKSKIRNNNARYRGGGIYNDYDSKIVLNHNQITGNTHYAIYRKGGYVNAKYNWWGSKKPRFSKIIKGKVIYKPWLKKKSK